MSTTVPQPPTAGQGADPTPLVGFRRDLRVEAANGDQVYVFSERGMTALHGSTAAALVGLLDGSRNLSRLLAEPPAGLSADQVAATISRLAEEGMVTLRGHAEGPAADDAAIGYWEGAGLDAARALMGTSTGRVAVITVGDIDSEPVVGALRTAGLTAYLSGEPDGADLSIVLGTDYLHPRLAEVDAAARRVGRPWLLAKPIGAVTWLGPVFQPPAPCWHCLADRLRRHRGAESCGQFALGHHGPVRLPSVTIAALAAASADLIALEAAKWLAGYRHPHQSCVCTFDSLSLTSTHHELRAAPQCASCGNPNLVREQARRPVVLRSRTRAGDRAGGHRVSAPEETLARYQHLISPVTGVVKGIRRADSGPSFFNSFRSGPNVATLGNDLASLRASMRAENGGKGTTVAQAEASALGEAIERYSGTFHGDEELVRGSLDSLGEQAVHPNICQLFDERQFVRRDSWNARHTTFQYVPPRFDPTAELNWTPVWSLTQSRHRLLPTEMLYFGSPAQVKLSADSNGNAAGASLEDAVLQGLLELVERDAVALWWYNRGRVPGIDLDSCADPWLAELREVYAGLDRTVWALDLTADLGVPTMAACSAKLDDDRPEILFGFGAHLDPQIALRRSLTELNQLMPALLAAERDGEPPCDDPDALRWFAEATLGNQPYLCPDPGQHRRQLSDYDYVPSDDIRAEIDVVRNRLESRGMELMVLDQTRPDVGLPVVKVIVPGLRHFWARFAPGRLFDVPVELGRQKEPRRYDELNPIPMFL